MIISNNDRIRIRQFVCDIKGELNSIRKLDNTLFKISVLNSIDKIETSLAKIYLMVEDLSNLPNKTKEK